MKPAQYPREGEWMETSQENVFFFFLLLLAGCWFVCVEDFKLYRIHSYVHTNEVSESVYLLEYEY